MGSFRCQCYPGYQLSANGRSCVIVPLILEPTGCGEYGCDLSCSPSGCEQISRVCPVGFIATETSSHVTCTDIDECAGNHSPCQHRCQNSVGSYKCSCRPGFYLHANGYTCIDFNECQRKRDKRLCQQSCQNTIGSFTCFCRPGYRLSADRVNCEDVDECREDVSLCPGRCRNTRGSYRCSCPEGFTQVGNNCQDINECHLQPSRCMHHCENLIGSYRCACPVGYRLLPDGKRCEDVNECAQPNASHCTHSCINTIGSYLCGCHHGYRLHIDKKSCIGEYSSGLAPHIV
ncbi:FBN3 protein, partial [Polypterus senegalus]|nr:FBN3 protein [Polypterus senegalus]